MDYTIKNLKTIKIKQFSSITFSFKPDSNKKSSNRKSSISKSSNGFCKIIYKLKKNK